MNTTTTDTPRTDAESDHPRNVDIDNGRNERLGRPMVTEVVPADFARQLERELNETKAEADKEHAKAVELSYNLIDCRKCAEDLVSLYNKTAEWVQVFSAFFDGNATQEEVISLKNEVEQLQKVTMEKHQQTKR